MRAKTLKELLVYQRAVELAIAINAILEAPGFRRDFNARDQLRSASDSIVANIAEGFPQSTDRSFAHFLTIACASAAEVRSRLQLAVDRRYLSASDVRQCDDLAEQVARMATVLARYLRRSNRRDRWTRSHPTTVD
jgi:four helix bundle protein